MHQWNNSMRKVRRFKKAPKRCRNLRRIDPSLLRESRVATSTHISFFTYVFTSLIFFSQWTSVMGDSFYPVRKIDLASLGAILISVVHGAWVSGFVVGYFCRNVVRKNCSFRCPAAAENFLRSTQCASDLELLRSVIRQHWWRLVLTRRHWENKTRSIFLTCIYIFRVLTDSMM